MRTPTIRSNNPLFAGMRLATLTLVAVIVLFTALKSARAAEAGVGDLERREGFVPFYWDEARGRVLIEIPVFNADVLYYVSAATGGGSVELPLDRGILSSAVIHFERSGPRVMVVQQNLDFRALGGTPAQQANVQFSFPTSILASLPVVEETDGRVIVDASALFIRDAAGLEARLRRVNQGVFRFDAGRSGFYPARMNAFPDNTEIETLVTYAVDNPGVVVANVVPDPRTMSLHIHHSFLRAPEGYTPRVADSRIGVSSLGFRNYSNNFDDSTEVNWVTRWRLEKQNPAAALSDPVKPIVFYLDPAIPEPVRSAMKEGTLWWNEAFEAAGFTNAVEVRDPTPDMDPMDIRYAWVLWIDRDERGFSSGGTFRDPRTGEILGSKTRMDSHRIRTIANYYESYTPGGQNIEGDMPPGERDMVLLRQSLLVAHELGHVLGFQHNWASSINERASVMEYPSPRVIVEDGRLNLTESFEYGVGEYDKFMARYAYSEFPPNAEQAGLDGVIAEMREADILFVPDTDPRWVWYDDRATPTEYLAETMAAREIMLNQYGPDMLELGEPLGNLRDIRFWMVYLHHRWAIEAGVGYIGGMYHNFVVKGEALAPTEIVPAALQRQVLAQLMEVISPANLILPETLLRELTITPGSNLEDMSNNYAFDQLSAARALAAMVVEPLLDASRAARLVAFADRAPDTVTLPEVVQALLTATWQAEPDSEPRLANLRRVTQRVVLDGLMMLGGAPEVTPEVRAYVLDQLVLLADDLQARRDRDPMVLAHYRQSARDILQYLQDPEEYAPEAASQAWGSRPRSRYPLPPGPPL